jgi:hypothetical protein
MIPSAQGLDLRPEGRRANSAPPARRGRMAAAASAAKPSRADARRVMPKACLRHDASEGHEGETFVRLV